MPNEVGDEEFRLFPRCEVPAFVEPVVQSA